MKNKNRFTCQICNKICNTAKLLTQHLHKYHKEISIKDYYDNYLKIIDEGICLNCGNETNFINIGKGYTSFCCLRCSNGNKEKQQKAEQTTYNHFGVKYPIQSKNVLDKMIQTMFEKYGVYNISQLSSVSQHKSEIMTNNWIKYRNEYIEKTIQTSLSVYGYESPNQCPLVQKKQQDTCFKNFGVRNPGNKCEKIDNKRKSTNIQRYGVENPAQADSVKQKHIKTSILKYGVSHPMQCREIMLKTKQKFKKDGKVYDSSWEYYYEQYLKQQNIKFEYQPDIYFWYEFNGKKHRYYPDFIVYNDDNSIKEIIEIKGDHLMKQMLNESTKEHQKYLCILANNVKLLHYQDLKNLDILK